jgi:4-hydroxythreonine-4-phosphate dehydrogenase
MTQNERIRIALTCGDPAGIGPEIIERWAASYPQSASLEFTAIGWCGWLERFADLSWMDRLSVGDDGFRSVAGRPSAIGSEVALAAMAAAAQGCKDGRFDAVVTGPVCKSALIKIGYKFPGQSEFFADRWGGAPTMAFTGGRLRVALATWHVPLREVPRHLDRDALNRSVRQAAWLARAEGIEEPRIGVCGLNPHAGEDGTMGTEEVSFINPALQLLRAELPGLSLCQSGDTLFARALQGEFDVIVALYHDQGLAPLKAIDFDEAVNVTLGLPFVRTSPDHGTAFSLAGTGKASWRSFSNAVDAAVRLTRYRRAEAEAKAQGSGGSA